MFPRGGSLRNKDAAPVADSAEEEGGNRGLFSTRLPENGLVGARIAKKKKSGKAKDENDVDRVVKEIVKKKEKEEARKASLMKNLMDQVENLPKAPHNLSFRSIKTGIKTIGIVTRVRKSSATVSLPGDIVGTISLEDLSDQHANASEECERDLEAYLHVGQMVRCAVKAISKDGARSVVELTMAASKINEQDFFRALVKEENAPKGVVLYGAVHSVEDHGYQVSFGFDNIVTGFLSFAKAGGSIDEPALKVGQVVLSVLDEEDKSSKKKPKGGRTVLKLDNNPAKVAAAESAEVTSIEQILPGMCVQAVVHSYLETGIIVQVAGLFTATVDLLHLKDWQTDLPLLHKAQSKKSTETLPRTRVLFVDLENKRIALTCLERLVNRGDADEKKDMHSIGATVGRTFQGVVRRVDKGRGVFLQLSMPEPVSAYARLSKTLDRDENKSRDDWIVEVNDKFKVGQETKCKVLNLNAADGVLSVSLAKEVVNASALTYEELQCGQRVTASVLRVTDGGAVIVSLGGPVHGVIPNLHLSEVNVSDPSSRFKQGQQLDLRVLEVDTTSNVLKPKLVLTNKRTLVQANLPLITRLEDVEPGLVTLGFVSGSTAERGVFVTFYNGISGRVDSDDLKKMGVTGDPSEVYKTGQVIKVKVLSKDQERERLRLSLFTSDSSEASASRALDGKLGTLVKGKIVGKDAGGFQVLLDDGATATLPFAQVCDHPSDGQTCISHLKKGTKIIDALVIDASKGIISLKPALRAASTRDSTLLLPHSVEELTEGSVVVGTVSNVVGTLGVFVDFLGGIQAFAPRANLSDGFVSDANEHFKRGQTVMAVVASNKPNEENGKRRVILTLKPSALLDVPAAFQALWLKDSLQFSHSTLQDKPAVCIGEIVRGKVSAVSDLGVEIALEGEKPLVGFCRKEHTKDGERVQIGDTVSCRVLDNSGTNGVIDVSMRLSMLQAASARSRDAARKTAQQVVSNAASEPSSSAKKKHARRDVCDAVVELVKSRYVVLSLPEYDHALMFAPTAGFNGPVFGLVDLETDVRCKVRVAEFSPEKSVLFGAMIPSETTLNRKRARSRGDSLDFSSSQDAKEIEVGSRMTGTVLDVKSAWVSVNLPNARAGKVKVHGQIHIRDCVRVSDSLEQLADAKETVLDRYSVGDEVQVQVRALQEKKNAAGKSYVNALLVLCGDESDENGQEKPQKKQKKAAKQQQDQSPDLTFADLVPGASYFGFIEQVHDDSVSVTLSRGVLGRVYCAQVSRDIAFLEKVFNRKEHALLKVGSVVRLSLISATDKVASFSMIQ